jgi:hypothetical protein
MQIQHKPVISLARKTQHNERAQCQSKVLLRPLHRILHWALSMGKKSGANKKEHVPWQKTLEIHNHVVWSPKKGEVLSLETDTVTTMYQKFPLFGEWGHT